MWNRFYRRKATKSRLSNTTLKCVFANFSTFSLQQVCDGKRDCQDGSDERAGDEETFTCVRTRHPITRTCLLPLSITYDDVADCDRNMDLLSLPQTDEENATVSLTFVTGTDTSTFAVKPSRWLIHVYCENMQGIMRYHDAFFNSCNSGLCTGHKRMILMTKSQFFWFCLSAFPILAIIDKIPDNHQK